MRIATPPTQPIVIRTAVVSLDPLCDCALFAEADGGNGLGSVVDATIRVAVTTTVDGLRVAVAAAGMGVEIDDGARVRLEVDVDVRVDIVGLMFVEGKVVDSVDDNGI